VGHAILGYEQADMTTAGLAAAHQHIDYK